MEQFACCEWSKNFLVPAVSGEIGVSLKEIFQCIPDAALTMDSLFSAEDDANRPGKANPADMKILYHGFGLRGYPHKWSSFAEGNPVIGNDQRLPQKWLGKSLWKGFVTDSFFDKSSFAKVYGEKTNIGWRFHQLLRIHLVFKYYLKQNNYLNL